jgi:RNA polymerase sigma-70 factor (ECF subfamily)
MVVNAGFAETELISLLKGGDEQAYMQIYDHYAPPLLNYAASRLADLQDAEDLVHDVFLKLWTSRVQVKEIKPYLYALMRNRIIDFVRRNATRTVYSNMLQALASEPEYNMEQELHAKELEKMVEHALGQLPDRMREIYLLSHKEQLGISQISSLLKISEQTVKNQLSMARKQLRQAAKDASLLVILYLLY